MSQPYKTRPDYVLLFVVAALLSVGMLMVFSASPTMAMRIGDSYYYLKRHLFALIVGSFALYAGYKIDHRELGSFARQIMGASILLLMLLFIPGIGVGIGGASRWIFLGIFSLQPSEIAKLALIIFLAKELSEKKMGQDTLPALGAVILTILLVLKQPDMGTSIILSVISFSLFYLAGLEIKYVAWVIFGSISSVFLLSIIKPYRFHRLIAYIDPWKDPQGIGYHIIQSLIAVGSGGLFGLGLGGSMQKFYYLPQNYTDFIFAIFCEEMGLFWALGVILLFLTFIGRGIKIVKNAPDAYSMLLSGGIVSWIGFQALLNISVVLGVLPTTGIPLPFVSYGGTSIVTLLFSVGLLLNISQYKGGT